MRADDAFMKQLDRLCTNYGIKTRSAMVRKITTEFPLRDEKEEAEIHLKNLKEEIFTLAEQLKIHASFIRFLQGFLQSMSEKEGKESNYYFEKAIERFNKIHDGEHPRATSKSVVGFVLST